MGLESRSIIEDKRWFCTFVCVIAEYYHFMCNIVIYYDYIQYKIRSGSQNTTIWKNCRSGWPTYIFPQSSHIGNRGFGEERHFCVGL